MIEVVGSGGRKGGFHFVPAGGADGRKIHGIDVVAPSVGDDFRDDGVKEVGVGSCVPLGQASGELIQRMLYVLAEDGIEGAREENLGLRVVEDSDLW